MAIRPYKWLFIRSKHSRRGVFELCQLVAEDQFHAAHGTVAVLGNDDLRASIPGEIIPAREFYDYQAKYVDDDSRLLIPAPMTPEQVREAQPLPRGDSVQERGIRERRNRRCRIRPPPAGRCCLCRSIGQMPSLPPRTLPGPGRRVTCRQTWWPIPLPP